MFTITPATGDATCEVAACNADDDDPRCSHSTNDIGPECTCG